MDGMNLSELRAILVEALSNAENVTLVKSLSKQINVFAGDDEYEIVIRTTHNTSYRVETDT